LIKYARNFEGVMLKFYVNYRNHRAKPLIVDPGLYMSKKSDVFWVTQRRELPTAFKLFTGNFFHPKKLLICFNFG